MGWFQKKMVRKRIKEGIFGYYQMNYFKEINLYIDIASIVYMLRAKIFLKVDVKR